MPIKISINLCIAASLLVTVAAADETPSVKTVPAKTLTGRKNVRSAARISNDGTIERRIPNLVLPDTNGKQVGLADFGDQRCLIVVFLSTSCPIANAYVPELLALQAEYAAKKVTVLAINGNAADSAESIARHAKEFKITFPVLVDSRQTTVPLFGARRMAEVFLLDSRRVVRYQGRIDDRIGYSHKRDVPQRRDLKEALDEVLAGKPVSMPVTETAGCLITQRSVQEKKGTVTYAEHVAPILQAHCTDCHRPGTAAPFSLLTYDDAANWADMIREVVVQRRMPPWHADPRFGAFCNDRRLSPDDVDTVAAWAESGAPKGETRPTAKPHGNDAQVPPTKSADGWRIGKPDIVFKMPHTFKVPATGKVEYQYFTTKTDFKEDVWIQSAEVRPGNRAAVHHVIVFYKGEKSFSGPGTWIASTAPGAEPLVFPPGLGRKIPAGAELIWQVHYTPTGKEEVDQSEIGLVFCKEVPKHDVKNYGIANTQFKIPAGEPNQEVISSCPIVKDTVLLSLAPHMHLRGKDFTYEAIFTDGRTLKLLSVPQFDFNWQNTYRFKEPLHLPKGSRIQCVAHYDNSAANPANPDPKKVVHWGDQTWDEMMIGYVDFYWEDDNVKTRVAKLP